MRHWSGVLLFALKGLGIAASLYVVVVVLVLLRAVPDPDVGSAVIMLLGLPLSYLPLRYGVCPDDPARWEYGRVCISWVSVGSMLLEGLIAGLLIGLWRRKHSVTSPAAQTEEPE
jgi:hypothetical protein